MSIWSCQLALLVAIASAMVCGAVPVHAQTSLPELSYRLAERLGKDVAAYNAILDAYAAADDALGIQALLRWERDRLEKVVDVAGSERDAAHPWQARRFGLAAMLHTDVALSLSKDLATADAFYHAEVAADWWQEGAVRHRAVVQPLVSRWYFTMSRYLRSRQQPFVAQRLLDIGRTRLPHDPVVLSESGILAESLATDFAFARTPEQQSRASGRANPAPALSEFDLVRGESPFAALRQRRAGRLRDAVKWLREACELDPGNDQLRVHLGRVHALRLDDEEATQLLGSVLATTPDDATAYLAGVFIAAVRERQNRLPEAVAAYRAALDRFPRGHAARIGLSHVLQRSGNGDAAREVVGNLLAESDGPTQEPRWWYTFERPGVADGRLEALRHEIRRQTR